MEEQPRVISEIGDKIKTKGRVKQVGYSRNCKFLALSQQGKFKIKCPPRQFFIFMFDLLKSSKFKKAVELTENKISFTGCNELECF